MADVYEPTDAKKSNKLLYAILMSVFLGLFMGGSGYYMSREPVPSLLISLVTIAVLMPIMMFVFRRMRSLVEAEDLQQYKPLFEVEHNVMSIFRPAKYAFTISGLSLGILFSFELRVLLALLCFSVALLPFTIRQRVILTEEGMIIGLSIFGFNLSPGKTTILRWPEFSSYTQSGNVFRLFYKGAQKLFFRARDAEDRVAQILESHIQKQAQPKEAMKTRGASKKPF